jgi:hypothetical protein
MKQPSSSTSPVEQSFALYMAASFRSLKHRRLRWYFAGVGVSLLGTFLQLMLLRWAAFDITGSSVSVGLMSTCALVPNALLCLPAGIIVSKNDKRDVLLLTQVAAGLFAALMTYLAFTGSLSERWILSVSLACGCIMPFETAARFPLMAECVEGDPPFNAFSLSATIFFFSRLIAPLLGGAILGLFSLGTGFALNLASFVVEIFTLLRMGRGKKCAATDGTSYVAVAKFCLTRANARLLIGVVCVSFWGVQVHLMPLFAADVYHGGSLTFSFLLAATELGAMAAAFWLATRSDAFVQTRVIAPSAIALSVALVTLCVSGWLPLGLAAAALSGLAQCLLVTASHNALQGRSDSSMRAPLSGLYWAAVISFQGLGSGALALTASRFDIRYVFTIAAAGILAVPLLNGWTKAADAGSRRTHQ